MSNAASRAAFAREGADVSIIYLPAEEPDAREGIRPENEARSRHVIVASWV